MKASVSVKTELQYGFPTLGKRAEIFSNVWKKSVYRVPKFGTGEAGFQIFFPRVGKI